MDRLNPFRSHTLSRRTIAASILAAMSWVGVAHADDVPSATRSAPIAVERALPLEGGVNFRDLGGYATADGREVRRGLLYRSGTMTGLTAKDQAQLRQLGIAVIADFRSTEERQREPTRWPEGGAPVRRLERDYDLEFGEVVAVLRDAPDAASARAAFASFYRRLPSQFADQYRAMFAELVAGNVPLAFNCSAGKDRTGVAAALILTALGVPRETVTEDYLLSNRYYKPKPPTGDAQDDPTARLFARLPPEVTAVFMGVEAEFLDAAFAGMVEEYGSVEGYLERAIGLDAAARETLRQRYTEVAIAR